MLRCLDRIVMYGGVGVREEVGGSCSDGDGRGEGNGVKVGLGAKDGEGEGSREFSVAVADIWLMILIAFRHLPPKMTKMSAVAKTRLPRGI